MKIIQPPGLSVSLDNLTHQYDPTRTPADKPHIFVYFLTIANQSQWTVTLLGRKWVIEQADGETLVIEGEKIVGETPLLNPGEKFSYNSFHLTGMNAVARGSFHGVTPDGVRVRVPTPPIELRIPDDEPCS